MTSNIITYPHPHTDREARLLAPLGTPWSEKRAALAAALSGWGVTVRWDGYVNGVASGEGVARTPRGLKRLLRRAYRECGRGGPGARDREEPRVATLLGDQPVIVPAGVLDALCRDA